MDSNNPNYSQNNPNHPQNPQNNFQFDPSVLQNPEFQRMFMFFQSQSNYQNSQQATQQSPQSFNHLSQQQVQPSFPISQHISQQHEQPNENDDVVEIQSQENENTPTSKNSHNIKVSMECR